MAATQIDVRLPKWDNDSLEMVCGIANAGGGRILITSNKKGSSTGFRKMRRPFEQIPDLAFKELGIICTTSPVMNESGLTVEINIPYSPDPISFIGQYWLYTKAGNIITSREEILTLHEEQASDSWELRSLPFAKREDISTGMLLKFSSIPLSKFEQDCDASTNTLKDRLAALHLINHRSQELVNAGALLLCNNPERFIPGASIRIALFDSEERVEKHDDILGPLSKQVDNAMEILMNEYLPAISNSRAFMRGLPPWNAIKEALTNAAIHKDYSGGVPIRVSVHPDRIDINNIGRPPEDWDIDELLSNHAPRPNNPVLATACRLIDMASGWGNGLNSMMRECTEIGVDAPIIEMGRDSMTVSFPLPSSKRGASAVLKRTGGSPNRGTNALSSGRQNANFGNSGIHRTTTGSAAASSHASKMAKFAERSIAAANKLDMTATDEYVLQILATNGRLSASRIAEALGVSESTVRRSFRKLKEYEFIERIGSDKSGYWSVNL